MQNSYQDVSLYHTCKKKLSIMYKFTNIISAYLLIFYYNGIIKFTSSILLLNTILIYLCNVGALNNQSSINNSILISLIIVSLSLCINIGQLSTLDGWMECVLSTTSAITLCISKLCALLTISFIMLCITLPIITIFYDLDINIYRILSYILVSAFINALIVLFFFIQQYFNRRGYILSILILPLVLPVAMLASMLDNNSLHIVMILGGIDMVIIPIIVYISSYLSNNIYNFQ